MPATVVEDAKTTKNEVEVSLEAPFLLTMLASLSFDYMLKI